MTHHDDEQLYGGGEQNEDVAHEHSDVNVRSLLVFAFGLIAIVVVCAVAMGGLFKVFERQAAANDPVMSPLVRPARQPAPEPRLLLDEPQNLQRFRTEQAEAMQGIDGAKKQMMQQGYPVRAGAPVDAWMGTHSASRGESSGGRAIPLKPGSGAMDSQQPPAPAPTAPQKSGGH